jgi:hypothetical protein
MHIENVTSTSRFRTAWAAALLPCWTRARRKWSLRPPRSKRHTRRRSASRGPGIDGVYAGISRGENGEPDGHLVLLEREARRDMKWDDAVKWAEGLGDGARLPTRFESALLYANLQDQFDTDRWHWTGTQYSERRAGPVLRQRHQYTTARRLEARARAVRRLIL